MPLPRSPRRLLLLCTGLSLALTSMSGAAARPAQVDRASRASTPTVHVSYGDPDDGDLGLQHAISACQLRQTPGVTTTQLDSRQLATQSFWGWKDHAVGWTSTAKNDTQNGITVPIADFGTLRSVTTHFVTDGGSPRGVVSVKHWVGTATYWIGTTTFLASEVPSSGTNSWNLDASTLTLTWTEYQKQSTGDFTAVHSHTQKLADFAAAHATDSGPSSVQFLYGCDGITVFQDYMRVTSTSTDDLYDFEAPQGTVKVPSAIGSACMLSAADYPNTSNLPLEFSAAGTWTLYSRAPGTDWTRQDVNETVARGTADAGASVRVPIAARRNMLLKVVYGGSQQSSGSASDDIAVQAVPEISVTAAREVRKGKSFAGSVKIVPAGRYRVRILVARPASKKKWGRLTTYRTVTTSAKGVARFGLPTSKVGLTAVLAEVGADADFADAISRRPVIYRVTPPPKPSGSGGSGGSGGSSGGSSGGGTGSGGSGGGTTDPPPPDPFRTTARSAAGSCNWRLPGAPPSR